jgi:hypothetical protein
VKVPIDHFESQVVTDQFKKCQIIEGRTHYREFADGSPAAWYAETSARTKQKRRRGQSSVDSRGCECTCVQHEFVATVPLRNVGARSELSETNRSGANEAKRENERERVE